MTASCGFILYFLGCFVFDGWGRLFGGCIGFPCLKSQTVVESSETIESRCPKCSRLPSFCRYPQLELPRRCAARLTKFGGSANKRRV